MQMKRVFAHCIAINLVVQSLDSLVNKYKTKFGKLNKIGIVDLEIHGIIVLGNVYVFDTGKHFPFTINTKNFVRNTHDQNKLVLELCIEQYLREKEMQKFTQEYTRNHGGADKWIILN